MKLEVILIFHIEMVYYCVLFDFQVWKRKLATASQSGDAEEIKRWVPKLLKVLKYDTNRTPSC